MTPYRLVIALFLLVLNCIAVSAAPQPILDHPPLSERWFGIYVGDERVGFYRQSITENADGYTLDGRGSIRMKVMGFSKIASSRETYRVSKSLDLRSFDVDQTIDGVSSHVSGKVNNGSMRIRNEVNGKSTETVLKVKGDIYPGPALNIYPLMRDSLSGSTYKIQTFDPEELKIKEVTITFLGAENSPEGRPALKLRNNLYPYVTNDIWVDREGNTLMESVREGLVITRSEDPAVLGAYIGNLAMAKKDLIFDFSLVRVEPPIKEPKKVTGLAVEISGWNDALPLLQEGGQLAEKHGEGRVIMKTGSLAQAPAEFKPAQPTDAHLKPAEKIESDAPEIMAQAKGLATGTRNQEEVAKVLASWTSDWLKDTLEDGGSAIDSFKSRRGNCQTHARLYTALARAAGIPTRFVSGLVYLDGKGFLYHSWAESFVDNRWISVDPTYNQLPADPTHLKLFEGHRPENLAPIIAIIGRIKITTLETKY